MAAQLLDGSATASAIKAELRDRTKSLLGRGIRPGLGTLLVGEDPASRSYVAGKHRDCAEIGLASIARDLPVDATQEEIEHEVRALNTDPDVTAFIVQLPLPEGIDQERILGLIDPSKDADGLHPRNLGNLVLRADRAAAAEAPLPCTPLGIVALLERHGVALDGARIVVIGRSVTVGRPLGLLLTQRGIDATVVLTHSRTRELAEEVRRADVVVAAVGRPHLVQPAWIKPGAAVIDVGITRVGTAASGRAKLAGDVDPAVGEVAAWLSPNPGGVGPMTRAMLAANVIEIAERTAGAGRRSAPTETPRIT